MPTPRDVYRKLKEDAFHVYWPGSAPSPAQESACIVRDSGDVPVDGTDVLGIAAVTVDVCVPALYYGELPIFLQTVLISLNNVPGLRYNGTSESRYDNDMQAHVKTIMYNVSKRYR